MILTTSKDWTDIKDALAMWNLKKVVVVGCGECSAQCGTGGTEGTTKLVEALQKDNIQVITSIIIQEPCDMRAVKLELRRIKDAVDKADGLVVAACGSGAQTVAEAVDKPTIITTNTIMPAQTERIGVYHEKCVACGTCWLNETGGICPITACAKSLLNGPCGGVKGGKCEVGNYTRSCGWVKIYEKLKAQNKLELFSKYRPPMDYTRLVKRKDTDLKTEMKSYYACPK